MEKVATHSEFVGYSTEIIQQNKIKGPLQDEKCGKIKPGQKSNNFSKSLEHAVRNRGG